MRDTNDCGIGECLYDANARTEERSGRSLVNSGAEMLAKYAPQETSVWVGIGHVGNDRILLRTLSVASTSSARSMSERLR